MNEQLIQAAMETGNQEAANLAFSELDAEIANSAEDAVKAQLVLRKAVLYGVLRRFDDARSQLDLAMRTAGSDISIRLQRAFISASLHDQEGEPKKALEKLTSVLTDFREQMNSGEFRHIYEDIQQRRGFDLVAISDFGQAKTVLEECLTFDLSRQDKSNVLAKLGICHSQLEEYGKARDRLLEACELGLSEEVAGDARLHLAATFAQLGLFDDAKREFLWCEGRAVELGLDLREIHEWLAWVCKGLGEVTEAQRYTRMAKHLN